MGLEFLSQPQVFISPITAAGGIQIGLHGNSQLPPLYTSFYTWTSTTPSVTANVFFLNGIETLTSRSGSYIVTVGGVLQSPTTYTVDVLTRTLTFSSPVNTNTDVLITQIGTIATSSLNITNLTAQNCVFKDSTFTSLSVQNLTAANITVVSNNVFGATTFTNLVSGLALQVGGRTLYVPLLSAL